MSTRVYYVGSIGIRKDLFLQVLVRLPACAVARSDWRSDTPPFLAAPLTSEGTKKKDCSFVFGDGSHYLVLIFTRVIE